MSDEDAFLKAICDQPDDDTPRLVYADWLQERDDDEPRAEFIRVQCERGRGLGDRARRTHLLKRSMALIQQFGARWYARDWPDAGPRPVSGYTFDRGFVGTVSMAGRGVTDAAVAAVCASRPLLALASSWNLAMNPLTDAGLAALADCPRLARLRALILSAVPITPDGIERLAASPHLAALAEVTISPWRAVADAVHDPVAALQAAQAAEATFRRYGKAVRVRT